MKKAVAVCLCCLTLLLANCAVTSDFYPGMTAEEIVEQRVFEIRANASLGYGTAVTRSVSRYAGAEEPTVTIDYFARNFEPGENTASGFLRASLLPDGRTPLDLECWRDIAGTSVRYEVRGAAVYADIADETVVAAQASEAWNFLPLVAWNHFGEMVTVSDDLFQYASFLPIGTLLTEAVFAGYAETYQEELMHIRAGGTSGIDLSFDFQSFEWNPSSTYRIDIVLTFDLDSEYDGETTRIIASYSHRFRFAETMMEYEFEPLFDYDVYVLADSLDFLDDPLYWLWCTVLNRYVTVDASVLAGGSMEYYMRSGIYDISTAEGFPEFGSELSAADGTTIPISDGAFAIFSDGFYRLRITAYDEPILSFRVVPRN